MISSTIISQTKLCLPVITVDVKERKRRDYVVTLKHT